MIFSSQKFLFQVNIAGNAPAVATWHLSESAYSTFRGNRVIWWLDGNLQGVGRINGQVLEAGAYQLKVQILDDKGTVVATDLASFNIDDGKRKVIRTNDLAKITIEDNSQIILEDVSTSIVPLVKLAGRKNVSIEGGTETAIVGPASGSMVSLNSASTNIVIRGVGLTAGGNASVASVAGTGIAIVGCDINVGWQFVGGGSDATSSRGVLIQGNTQKRKQQAHFVYACGTDWVVCDNTALLGSGGENQMRIPTLGGNNPACLRSGWYYNNVFADKKCSLNPRAAHCCDVIGNKFAGPGIDGCGELAFGPTNIPSGTARDLVVRENSISKTVINIHGGISDVWVEGNRVNNAGVRLPCISIAGTTPVGAGGGSYSWPTNVTIVNNFGLTAASKGIWLATSSSIYKMTAGEITAALAQIRGGNNNINGKTVGVPQL